MSLLLVLTVGVLVAVGLYLLLEPGVLRPAVGVAVLGHAVVLLLVTTGPVGRAPLVDGGTGAVSDPLPQALGLTAVVISFAVTALLLTTAAVRSDAAPDASSPGDAPAGETGGAP